MPASLSQDLRERTCVRWKADPRAGGHRHPIPEPHEVLVRALLNAKADISLVEIRAELHRHCIVVGATSTISRWLTRAGLTHKKEPESRRAGSRGRRARTPTLARVAALHE